MECEYLSTSKYEYISDEYKTHVAEYKRKSRLIIMN